MRKEISAYNFEPYLTKPLSRSIVLRHDVDKRPPNSIALAKIEQKLGLKEVYNFRTVPVSWDEEIIKEISSLGHEIGYHCENLSICNGNHERAMMILNYADPEWIEENHRRVKIPFKPPIGEVRAFPFTLLSYPVIIGKFTCHAAGEEGAGRPGCFHR